MEYALFGLAVAVLLGLQHWDHRDERKAWEADRAMLLDRIQAPVVFEARAAEAAEAGGVSYVGNESDTAGITGGDDATEAS